jgi:hypothetical protein
MSPALDTHAPVSGLEGGETGFFRRVVLIDAESEARHQVAWTAALIVRGMLSSTICWIGT